MTNYTKHYHPWVCLICSIIWLFLGLVLAGVIFELIPVAKCDGELEAYPLGVERESSIGNAKYGHIRIKQSVSKIPSGGYEYKYYFFNATNKICKVKWNVLFFEDNKSVELELGANIFKHQDFEHSSPVWKLDSIRFDVKINNKWHKVGTWHQKGPVPSK